MCWTSHLLAAALFAGFGLQAQVPAQDARNLNLPNTDTHFTPKIYQTLAEWEAHKACERRSSPRPDCCPCSQKTDLHPQIFGRIENRDYSIEKVLLETLPGYYLGGNLYRPLQARAAGGFPAVISPARPLELRPPGAHHHRLRARARHQPGAPGLRGLRL